MKQLGFRSKKVWESDRIFAVVYNNPSCSFLKLHKNVARKDKQSFVSTLELNYLNGLYILMKVRLISVQPFGCMVGHREVTVQGSRVILFGGTG